MAFFETLGIVDGIIVLLTLAGLVFISLRFGGKAKSSDEYNNAGKSLNIWVVVGSTIATFMGAYSGLGSPQLILSVGLSGLTVALMWNVGWAFQCLMARPLRASGVSTLPEFIAIKYGRSTRMISSWQRWSIFSPRSRDSLSPAAPWRRFWGSVRLSRVSFSAA